MIRRALPSLRDAAWHPGDEQLIAHIDAELEVRDAARVADHLARCWTCRVRRQQLQDTIGAFMHAYAGIIEEEEAADDHEHVSMPRAAAQALRTPAPASLRLPSLRVSSLLLSSLRVSWLRSSSLRLSSLRLSSLRLSSLRVSCEPVFALARRAGQWLSQRVPTRPVAVRLVAAFATAVVVFVLSSETQVSAVQLVRHVDAAERTLLDHARAPVVHQRLEVARRQLPGGNAVAGTWDVWTDVDLQRRHSRPIAIASTPAPADDLARALFALFDRQGMRDAWPVSLRSHQQWRARERTVRDAVESGRTSTGESTLTLDTTLAASASAAMASGIVRATLVVRERDWHPVEQRLLVRQDGATAEFVVREAHVEVVPLASLPIAFFNESPAAGDRVADRLTPDASAAGAATSVARDVDLVTSEVQAMYALHRVGLTAEDDISVTRRDHQVDVRGITTTDSRRKQLTAALARIPFVRARIRTADEALAAALAAHARVPPPLQFDETQIQADRLPAQGASAAAADPAMMHRARTAVTHSLTLLERAWALRRLAEWITRTRASHITRTTRELIDVMAREHADAASQALAALDSTIAAALPAGSAETSPPPPSVGAWTDLATDFFGIAAEIDRDTRRLFTASAAPTGNAADDAQRLRHGLDEAAQRLKALARARP